MQSTALPLVRKFMDTRTHALAPDDDILVAVQRLINEGVTDAPVLDGRGTVIEAYTLVNIGVVIVAGFVVIGV